MDSQKMMFVSGETGDPDAETTSMIEMIVQEQVKEMVSGISYPAIASPSVFTH